MSYLALVESYISEIKDKSIESTLRYITGLEQYSPYDKNDIYDTRELIKKYMQLCFWFTANQDNKILKEEEISAVVDEIEILESELVAVGTSAEVIDKAIKLTSDLANKKLSDLTSGQQLKLVEAIFGHVEEVPPLSKA